MYPGGNVIRVTPTLSTDAYADNDILFLTTEIPNAVSNRGGVSNIVDISLHSKTIVELDMDIIFMEEQIDYGSINAYSSATELCSIFSQLNIGIPLRSRLKFGDTEFLPAGEDHSGTRFS